MASKDRNGDGQRRARSVIHEAQERCLDWQHLCLGTHQGYADIEPGVSIRGFHNAVLGYWSVLRPYRLKNNVKELWEDDELLTLAPFEVGDTTVNSLADLGGLRYASNEHREIERDMVKGSKVNRRNVPAYLDPAEASDVLDALNDIAEHLKLLADIHEGRQLYHIPAGGDENEYPEPWGEAKPPTS